MLYPFVSMVAGGMAGVGLSAAAGTDGQGGFGWVLVACAAVFAAPMVTAWARRVQERKPPERFSPARWQADIKDLDQRRFLSRDDRHMFEDQAGKLTAEGRRVKAEAGALDWSGYWRTSSRKMRVLAFAWIALGVLASCGPLWGAGVVWPLAFIPAGASFVLFMVLDWNMKRRGLRLAGERLEEAAMHIGERLRSLPSSERSFIARLRYALAGD